MESNALLDRAGRRRSPATTSTFRRRPTKAFDTRPTRRRSRRSSRRCALPETVPRVSGCAAWSSCSGARDCGSAKRWPSTRPTSTPTVVLCSFDTGRAISAARSGWTAGRGRTSAHGSSFAPISRSGACSVWVRGRTRGRPCAPAGVRKQLHVTAVAADVRRRFAPHQLRHADAVEMSREGVSLIVIQRQLGHADLAITSRDLRGIDNTEIIQAVHQRPEPMIPAGRELLARR
jgi:hypothetical protein